MEYRSITDKTLLSFLQKGDEQAFSVLYDRYWKKLFIRANLLLNSTEDAEEVVHDVFVTLWQKRTTLKIHHSFHTYIAAMLRYNCFEILTKRNKKKQRLIDYKNSLPQTDFPSQQWLQFEDLQIELEEAVSRLPEKCQLIFRLSREQDLSNKEIAYQLNLSVNTVRTQMHRALKRLKTSLNSFFFL
ncbi:MAG TPA: RNA polymerase sigma-70 factor [Chitinophagaceae bacterium]|nr:RNA polymerase sigma-70 factor [Chitinophagaceae bacterium]